MSVKTVYFCDVCDKECKSSSDFMNYTGKFVKIPVEAFQVCNKCQELIILNSLGNLIKLKEDLFGSVCEYCNGKGEMRRLHGYHNDSEHVKCEQCNGTGKKKNVKFTGH